MVHQLFKILTWMGSEWVLVILFILSILVLAVILGRWFELRRLLMASQRFWDEHAEAWFRNADAKTWRKELEGLKTNYPCLECDTLDIIVKGGADKEAEVDRMVDAYLNQKKLKLERYVGILGTIGANAPFIGLFGTVLGIIRAFHDMSVLGLSQGMENISGGIAEALVATAIGLMVAIPAVIFFNILNKRIGILIRRAHSVSYLALSRDVQSH